MRRPSATLGALLVALVFSTPGALAQPENPGEDQEVLQLSIEELEQLAAASPDQLAVGAYLPPRAGSILDAAGLDWFLLGPRPIRFEYWSGTADAGGRVCAVLVHPTDSNVIYIAAAGGGVWKSTDGGITWTPLTDGLSSLASGALAFDPVNPDIVWYATGEQHYSSDSFYGDGLFRSLDAGSSWTKIASKALVGSYVARLAIKPTDANLMIAASDRGVVRSIDGGIGWSVVLAGGWSNDLAIDPVTPATAFATVQSLGVYKSTNSGGSWTKLTVGLPVAGFGRINLAMSPSNPLVLYASFVNSATGGLLGMYRTSDGGASWSALGATPNYLTSQGWYDNCVAVDPGNPDVCYAGGVFPYGGGAGGVIKTTNGGTSWTNITVGSDGSQVHPDQHFLTFGSDGALWLSNDGGVWKTTDGGSTWINRNDGLAVSQSYTLALHPTDPDFMLSGTQDNGTVVYGGAEDWPQLVGGDGGGATVEWDSPNIFYSTYVYLNPLYKWDAGAYVATVTGPWAGERANWCNAPLTVDPNTANTLLAGTYRVWRSPDSGGTWSAISPDLTGGGHLRAIAPAPGVPGTLYTGSSDGRVYLTTDGGTNWNPKSTGLSIAPIPDLVVNPADAQQIWVCQDRSTGNRVLRSTNGGTLWLNLTGDLPTGIRAMCLAVDFRTATPRLYAGTDFGIYVSTNSGTNWRKADSALPNTAVYDLAVDAVNNRVVAATHGRGQWAATTDIVAPSLAITAPVGGELWVQGTTHDVTWSASDAGGVESVALQLSTDGGASYGLIIASGIPNTGSYAWNVNGAISDLCRVKVLADDAAGNQAVVASPADFSIIDPSLVAVEDGRSRGTVLRPVAPNPARAPLRIDFELARREQVTLEVFDVSGRQLQVLETAPRDAGAHSVTWDGSDDRGVPAGNGIYFYRLRAGSFQQTRRLALLR